ncbi:MAG: iron-containing alcohol dehydrogenase, partial [Candidatus Methylomirabilis sp.]|nr:iron-containing alcohol dehydrogenase [Deltaproteobacteria bacterium]
FFHPRLMPDIAALEPALTAGLPPAITAATGMDAFTHCLESYLSPTFHPLADGVAFEGMRLVLQSLPVVVREGANVEARGRMQMAAAMGATAFQKGLGMTHSLAHPLSAEYDMHHGLANAVLLPFCLTFLETSPMSEQDREKLRLVRRLFEDHGLPRGGLGAALRAFVESLGLTTGLRNHGVPQGDLDKLADLAFKDPCHRSNMVPVVRDDLGRVYKEAW